MCYTAFLYCFSRTLGTRKEEAWEWHPQSVTISNTCAVDRERECNNKGAVMVPVDRCAKKPYFRRHKHGFYPHTHTITSTHQVAVFRKHFCRDSPLPPWRWTHTHTHFPAASVVKTWEKRHTGSSSVPQTQTKAKVKLPFPAMRDTYHIECEWQKSSAEMIWRKNLRASFGVRRPFFTR